MNDNEQSQIISTSNFENACMLKWTTRRFHPQFWSLKMRRRRFFCSLWILKLINCERCRSGTKNFPNYFKLPGGSVATVGSATPSIPQLTSSCPKQGELSREPRPIAAREWETRPHISGFHSLEKCRSTFLDSIERVDRRILRLNIDKKLGQCKKCKFYAQGCHFQKGVQKSPI